MGGGRDGLSTAGLLSLFLGQTEKVAQKRTQKEPKKKPGKSTNWKRKQKRCPPVLFFPCPLTLVPFKCQLNLNQAIDCYICSVLSGVHKYPLVGNSQSPVHPPVRLSMRCSSVMNNFPAESFHSLCTVKTVSCTHYHIGDFHKLNFWRRKFVHVEFICITAGPRIWQKRCIV